jgi:hypothetical protein
MGRVAKAVILGALGLTAILAGLYAYLTHGWLWSVYVPIYGRLLHAIPLPPGVVEGTEAVTLNPELPWGYMRYEVNQPHDESVAFFESRLPGAGWALLEHKGWTDEQGYYLRVDRLLYSRRSRYWLIVDITTRGSSDGAAPKPSGVYLEVHRFLQEATGRY